MAAKVSDLGITENERFWSVEDLREYKLVEETPSQLYFCHFNGSQSSVKNVFKRSLASTFMTLFKDSYIEAFEKQIENAILDIEGDKSVLEQIKAEEAGK